MLILRLKQAECALADGRLDEAADLLAAGEMRSYRRGQELAGAVARALVNRGRQHLGAGRLNEADGDCHRALRLAGNLVEAAQLRTAVANAMQIVQHNQQEKAAALATARQQIQQGQFSVGQQALEDVREKSPEAQLMLKDLNNRRAAIEAIAEKAAAALDRDDWQAAIELLASAGSHVGEMRLRELAVRTTRQVNESIEKAIDEGKLDLARALLARLGRIADGDVKTEQHRKALEQIAAAWRKIDTGELAEAGRILRRAQANMPSARWIAAAITDIEQAEGAMGRLRSGTIAMMESFAGGAARPAATYEKHERSPLHNEEPKPFTSRFFLQVDGVGAFAVVSGSRVSLGPISGTQRCDIGFIADASMPAVSIERMDEDYVLHAATPVLVNDKPVTRKLLADGDRIALSARCRFQFRRPSPASNTAVLDLTGARLGRADVRRVILMDREVIIGAGPAAHIRCDELPQSLVLCMRDGQLVCQAKCDVYVDEQAAGRTAAIGTGNHVRVGDLRMVVTNA